MGQRSAKKAMTNGNTVEPVVAIKSPLSGGGYLCEIYSFFNTGV